jgi:hypothetical protein
MRWPDVSKTLPASSKSSAAVVRYPWSDLISPMLFVIVAAPTTSPIRSRSDLLRP